MHASISNGNTKQLKLQTTVIMHSHPQSTYHHATVCYNNNVSKL